MNTIEKALQKNKAMQIGRARKKQNDT